MRADCPPNRRGAGVEREAVGRSGAGRAMDATDRVVTNSQEYPVDFDLDRTGGLRIRWTDSLESTIPLAELRRACPCATCRSVREQETLGRLRVLASPAHERDALRVEHAELAGRYALRVTWADGHNTGIYDFGLLRELGERFKSASH